ncbi:hypothetical protein Mgra_00004765 [Meloidogyne graminicola]|uniref:Uncharacterized protein n=1 Tax=Meloidogyne graminicola TaxID=189291 RepID=A0A8S9ZRN8_9BILA|nr:hypothetical protein Mgra_00004765 [Meloidogyne graminicola]
MRRKIHFELFCEILSEPDVYINIWQNKNEKIKLIIIKELFEIKTEKRKYWLEKIESYINKLKISIEQWNLDNNKINGQKEYNYLNPNGLLTIKLNKNESEINNFDLELIKLNKTKNEINKILKIKNLFKKILNQWILKNKNEETYFIYGTDELGINLIENVEINIEFQINEESSKEKYFGSDLSICKPLLSINCKDNSFYCFLCKESFEELKINYNYLQKYTTNIKEKYIIIKLEGIKFIIKTKINNLRFKTFQVLKEINENNELFISSFIALNYWAKSKGK